MITDIQNYTNFKWDEEKKMLVIPIEDLAEWKAYCEEFKEYVNKVKEPPKPTCKEIYEIVSNGGGRYRC